MQPKSCFTRVAWGDRDRQSFVFIQIIILSVFGLRSALFDCSRTYNRPRPYLLWNRPDSLFKTGFSGDV
ncbi:MAG: hypothetical protein WBL95_09445 [Microcoleus sp.]